MMHFCRRKSLNVLFTARIKQINKQCLRNIESSGLKWRHHRIWSWVGNIRSFPHYWFKQINVGIQLGLSLCRVLNSELNSIWGLKKDFWVVEFFASCVTVLLRWLKYRNIGYFKKGVLSLFWRKGSATHSPSSAHFFGSGKGGLLRLAGRMRVSSVRRARYHSPVVVVESPEA